MIARLVNFVAGDTEDGIDTVASIAILVIGFFLGMCIARLAENNNLMREVRSYLSEQRRIALANMQREMATAKESDRNA